jgi:hypothetical protein
VGAYLEKGIGRAIALGRRLGGQSKKESGVRIQEVSRNTLTLHPCAFAPHSHTLPEALPPEGKQSFHNGIPMQSIGTLSSVFPNNLQDYQTAGDLEPIWLILPRALPASACLQAGVVVLLDQRKE